MAKSIISPGILGIPVGITLVYTACLALPAMAQTGSAGKPNILFISVDDMRPQTSVYGYEMMKTPTFDQISIEGTRFEKAYCNVPVCGGSRASLLTGIRPTPTKFTIAATYAHKDAPGAISLPQAFKDAGYHTAAYGKIFHYPEDLEKESWSEPAWKASVNTLDYLDPQSKNFVSSAGRGPIWEAPDVPDNAYPDGMVAEKVIQDLGKVAKMDKPFFLAMGFYKPHMPFYAPKKYWDLYDPNKLELANNRYTPKNASQLKSGGEYKNYHLRGMTDNSDEFHRRMRWGYYACVSYIDAQIGKVLAKLKDEGLNENTMVIIWGDHGWNLGEHNFWGKHNLTDLSLRSPLIMNGPGIPKGLELKQLVEFVDIYPTLLDYAGITASAKVKGQLEGSSFMPLLKNPNQPWKPAVFPRWKDGNAMVTDRYSYITWGGSSKVLFDHLKDPNENESVANQAAYKPVLDSLEKMYAAGWKKAIPVPVTVSIGDKRSLADARRRQSVQLPFRFGSLSKSQPVSLSITQPASLEVRNAQGKTVLTTRLEPGVNSFSQEALDVGLHFYTLTSITNEDPGSSENGSFLVLP